MTKPLRKIEDVPAAATEKSALPQVVKALTGVLGSTYVLYQKSLYYHWNVRGANFYGLHKLFEEHYEELHNAGDVIAERIRALGYVAPGTLAEFLQLSLVKEDKDLPKDTATMVANLLESHEICSKQAQETLKLAEKSEDQVTMDLMVKRMDFHAKTAWMLRAIEPAKA
ncbi:MAG: Dps family protein [Alphaproteobacteria bacterium]